MTIHSFNNNQRPYWLQFIFDGKAHTLSHRFTINDGATINHQLKTGANLCHIISTNLSWQGNNVGPLVLDILENPTITNGTTPPAVLKNLDRRSAKVATTTYFTNPTGISGGVLIERVVIHGGDNKSANDPNRGIFELLLKPNEDYVFQFQNNTGGVADTYINIQFYESSN